MFCWVPTPVSVVFLEKRYLYRNHTCFLIMTCFSMSCEVALDDLR